MQQEVANGCRPVKMDYNRRLALTDMMQLAGMASSADQLVQNYKNRCPYTHGLWIAFTHDLLGELHNHE
jgi:hypothetical protein